MIMQAVRLIYFQVLAVRALVDTYLCGEIRISVRQGYRQGIYKTQQIHVYIDAPVLFRL